jgi:hypothetical protein
MEFPGGDDRKPVKKCDPPPPPVTPPPPKKCTKPGGGKGCPPLPPPGCNSKKNKCGPGPDGGCKKDCGPPPCKSSKCHPTPPPPPPICDPACKLKKKIDKERQDLDNNAQNNPHNPPGTPACAAGNPGCPGNPYQPATVVGPNDDQTDENQAGADQTLQNALNQTGSVIGEVATPIQYYPPQGGGTNSSGSLGLAPSGTLGWSLGGLLGGGGSSILLGGLGVMGISIETGIILEGLLQNGSNDSGSSSGSDSGSTSSSAAQPPDDEDPELEKQADRIAKHADESAQRPDGDGTHYVSGVHPENVNKYVSDVLKGKIPGQKVRYDLRNGRVAYWDPGKGAIVIEDGEGGTVFTPKDGYESFKNLR